MATNQTMQFQTEVNQLLDLMIHSLYSNREIFLRELISNGSDALDKRRFQGLTDASIIEGQGDPQILIEFDEEKGTLTITDNGIGMTRDEVIENIGTIAKSGTKAFIAQLEADEKDASNLIGQFGVGFYSAFIVADEIELVTRRAGDQSGEATLWRSEGKGEFEIGPAEKERAGTAITLHLREEHRDLLNEWQLKEIIKKYSDHIAYPVMMQCEKVIPVENEGEEPKTESLLEQVNSATSLWQRDRAEISDEEYEAFYQQKTHDYNKPLTWSHNRVEGNTSYTSLLYIPSVAPAGLWDQKVSSGIDLYVQRVFIMAGSEKLMPNYLRFINGVVDTQDLPLNISREILQNSKTIDTIRQGLVRRSLSMLESLSLNEPEKYRTLWTQFGRVLKEGFGEDFSNREKLAKLMRFSSTKEADEIVSFTDYVERMGEEQEAIYYLTADSLTTAQHSPHLELFKKRDIEVLLMTDVIDDWMMGFLHEFEGKPLVNVAKGDVELPDEKGKEEKSEAVKEEESALAEKVAQLLGDRVESVKISERLTDSASCLVRSEHALSGHFEKLLKEAGHDVPEMKPWLEINPDHHLLKALEGSSDEREQQDLALLIYEEAQLLEGARLENPAEFVARINRLMGR